MNLEQIHGLLAGLDDSHLTLCPYKGGHDLRWVLGHLAVSQDFAGSLLGLPATAPEPWNKMFGPGSSGSTSGGPKLAELVAVVDRGHAAIAAALPTCAPATLDKPHGMDFLAKTPLKSVGDLLAFLLTNHASYHIAQLSACRCVAGLKPLF